ncbi:MAG: hypothetical protein J6A19_05635 [Oscillospiraceae bacterium]|nr:hypothetical protein [Oscillospiraceae bacterium]
MKKEIKEKLPQWYNENTRKDLILSNDIDSLLSLKLLEQVKPKWKMKYFYDFESGLYYSGNEMCAKINAIGVDIALDRDIKTFDNHVTSDNGDGINSNSINLNNVTGIGSANYFKKYCCSTALLIYSLFDIPLPKTDIGKAVLLAIDSTYISYYNPIEKKKPEWLDIHKNWLCDVLGFPELYELEQQHSKEDFDRFSYINNAKIQVIDDWVDGRYEMYYPLDYKDEVEKALEISLDIPEESFSLGIEVGARSMYLNDRHKIDLLKENKIMSFAMTGKNYCNYSVYK